MTTERRKSLTYKDAGVDIEAGNSFVKRIIPLARRTQGPQVLDGIGGFAGLFAWPQGLSDPVLVASTDGVGTKLMVAFQAGRHDTVGIDLVAMSVNDILTVGARPLFFLDYIATGALDLDVAEQIIAGVAAGCEQAGCALLGGETAEMPGMYHPGHYDLAGFAVGVVDRPKMVNGSRCAEGDLVLGLPSNGLHSNGYSLARKVLLEGEVDINAPLPNLGGRSLADELLRPTQIYVAAARKLMEAAEVRAFCHVTGGGLVDNPPRVYPKSLALRFHRGSWKIPDIMMLIQERADIAAEEMRRTFNMGLGLLAVIPAAQAQSALRAVADDGGVIVGEMVKRSGDSVEWV